MLRGKSLGQNVTALPTEHSAPLRTTNAPPLRRAPILTPVSTPPIAVATIVPTEKPYTVQLVTYRKREYAEAELNTVRKMGFSGYVVQKGEYFLVYAGQYASKEEAKKDLNVFHPKYKDSFLTRAPK